jgi:hypothetical protein
VCEPIDTVSVTDVAAAVDTHGPEPSSWYSNDVSSAPPLTHEKVAVVLVVCDPVAPTEHTKPVGALVGVAVIVHVNVMSELCVVPSAAKAESLNVWFPSAIVGNVTEVNVVVVYVAAPSTLYPYEAVMPSFACHEKVGVVSVSDDAGVEVKLGGTGVGFVTTPVVRNDLL